MDLDYDFKLDVAKSMLLCLQKLLDSQTFISKSAIKQMKRADALVDKNKITVICHKQMCEKIKVADQYRLQKLICLFCDYVSHSSRIDFNVANYDMDEIIKQDKKYNKKLNKAIKQVAKIIAKN